MPNHCRENRRTHIREGRLDVGEKAFAARLVILIVLGRHGECRRSDVSVTVRREREGRVVSGERRSGESEVRQCCNID